MLREIDQSYIEENGESKVSNDVSMKKQMQNEDADRNDENFAEDRSLENEARIEKLNEESNVVREHSKQGGELRDQFELMKISLAETRILLKSSKRERDKLRSNFELAKKETRKTQEELCTLRSLKEEKDTTIKELLSEMEQQKETLQKQILQLKDELHKVQDVKKVEQENIIQDLPHSKSSTTKNKLATKEDNAAILERYETDLAELLKEMTLLKERINYLESELKEMSLKFARAESARQELEMTNRNLRNGKKN